MKCSAPDLRLPVGLTWLLSERVDHDPGQAMRIFAKVLSVVLHPLFMPLYTVGWPWRWTLSGFFAERWSMLAMLALMTVAFPITSTLLLQRSGPR